MTLQIYSVQRWTRYHALAIFTTILVAIVLKSMVPLAVVGFFSFAVLIYQHQVVESEQGLCSFWEIPANWVTLIRVILVCLVAVNYQNLAPVLLGFLGLFILILDKLDGYLAQKTKTTSMVGAQFDQEVDAFFITVYTFILYLDEYVSVWVLTLGLLRYVNILLLVLLKQQHKKEPRFLGARLVATMVMIALLVPFFIPAVWYVPYVAFSVIALIISFGYTFTAQILQSD